MTIEEAKLDEFVGKVVTEVGAAMSAVLVVIGDKLGLYRAMAQSVALTPAELAQRTETSERYVCEWLPALDGESTEFPGEGYDLIAHFDCLHDMEDPTGAAKHARRAIAREGTWLVVEPFAGDRPEHNHNGVGRVFYSASTMLCVPHSGASRSRARRASR